MRKGRKSGIRDLPNELFTIILEEVPLEYIEAIAHVNQRFRAHARLAYLKRVGALGYVSTRADSSNLSVRIGWKLPELALLFLLSEPCLRNARITLTCDLYAVVQFRGLLCQLFQLISVFQLHIETHHDLLHILKDNRTADALVSVLASLRECWNLRFDFTSASLQCPEPKFSSLPLFSPQQELVRIQTVLLPSISTLHLTSPYVCSPSLEKLITALTSGVNITELFLDLPDKDISYCPLPNINLPGLEFMRITTREHNPSLNSLINRHTNLQFLSFGIASPWPFYFTPNLLSIPRHLETLYISSNTVCHLIEPFVLSKLHIRASYCYPWKYDAIVFGAQILSLGRPLRHFTIDQLSKIRIYLEFPRLLDKHITQFLNCHENPLPSFYTNEHLIYGCKDLVLEVDIFNQRTLVSILPSTHAIELTIYLGVPS